MKFTSIAVLLFLLRSWEVASFRHRARADLSAAGARVANQSSHAETTATPSSFAEGRPWYKWPVKFFGKKSGIKRRKLIEECQKKECGESTLKSDGRATAFYNIKHHEDILVIPNEFYATIHDLNNRSSSPRDLLTAMLTMARSVYKEVYGKDPEWQCVNWRRQTVQWVHIHSFTGRVKGEGLPGGAYCWCEKPAKMSPEQIARKWLQLAGGRSKQMLAASGKITQRFMRYKGDAEEISFGDGLIPKATPESCYCLYSGCEESNARFPTCKIGKA